MSVALLGVGFLAYWHVLPQTEDNCCVLHTCFVLVCLGLQDADGQPKGAGIVEFQSPNEALQAISRLTNTVRAHSLILPAS